MRDAVDGYRLQALLARGNGYVCHRAEAIGQPGRPLAIELLETDAAMEVISETQACVRKAATLDHPGILPVLEVVPTQGGVAIVTPLAGGGSLADALALSGAIGFSDDAIAELRTHLTAALHHLHQHGLHHGAISAEQVRFDGAGTPLLTGVGTAALRRHTPTRHPDTPTRPTGTPTQSPDTPTRRPDTPTRRPDTATLHPGTPADADTLPMAAPTERDLRDLDALLAACSVRATDPALAPAHAPGPQQATPTRLPRRRRHRLLVAAVLVALTPIALVSTALVGNSPPAHLATPRQAAPACGGVDLDTIPGERHLVDVDGSGCATPALWDGSQLVITTQQGPPRTFYLDAAEGDELLFADLSCDGRDAPVLYRPSTGELFLFEQLIAGGETTTVPATTTGTPHGDPRVVVSHDGCDRIEVAATGTGQETG